MGAPTLACGVEDIGPYTEQFVSSATSIKGWIIDPDVIGLFSLIWFHVHDIYPWSQSGLKLFSRDHIALSIVLKLKYLKLLFSWIDEFTF